MSDVQGLAEANAALDALAGDIANMDLMPFAAQVAQGAQARTPVRTGTLKRSIGSLKIANGAAVEATARYASFVEDGTSNHQAQHMIQSAVDDAQPLLVDEVTDQIDNSIARLGLN